MHQVKFNLSLPANDFGAAAAAARQAEELKFYSVSVSDHFFMRGLLETPQTPHLECYTTLAALAASTHTIRLLPLVTAMSYRNPALLAKMMSTLDHISGGRLIAGLGAGWFKEEYLAYNFPYPSNSERIDRLADGIKVLKAMWTQDEPTYSGPFYSISKAYNFPRPVQQPHPPLMVGGSGKNVLRIAAEEADVANLIPPVLHGTVEISEALKFDRDRLAAKIAQLREFQKAAGREPDAVEISGMSIVLMAKDKSQAEAMIQATAQGMGVTDVDAARASMMILAGTPKEVGAEIRRRIEDFGMTYFVLNFVMPESIPLFAAEVMPEFVS